MQRRGFFGAIAGALAGVASLKLLPKPTPAPLPATALEPTLVVHRQSRVLVRERWVRTGFGGEAEFLHTRHFVGNGGRISHHQEHVGWCPFVTVETGKQPDMPVGGFIEHKYV